MATQPPNSSGGSVTPPVAVSASGGVTAANARAMFFAVGIMLVFVYGAAVIAGSSQATGRVVLVFMVGLLILQGVTRANPLAHFLASHPLTPKG